MNRDWRESAACAGRAPEFDAHILGESDRQMRARHEVAKQVCAGCSVIAECAADFVKHVDSGVRFGQVHGLGRNAVAGNGTGRVKREPRKRDVEALRREVLHGAPGDHNRRLGKTRRQVVVEMTQAGLSVREISERLKVSPRTIVRHRAEARRDEREAS